MVRRKSGSDASLTYSTLNIVHNRVDLLLILENRTVGVDKLVILLARLYWRF